MPPFTLDYGTKTGYSTITDKVLKAHAGWIRYLAERSPTLKDDEQRERMIRDHDFLASRMGSNIGQFKIEELKRGSQQSDVIPPVFWFEPSTLDLLHIAAEWLYMC
jgi:hypothetical protein